MAAENIEKVAGQEFLIVEPAKTKPWEQVQRRVAEIMGAHPDKISVSVREPQTQVEAWRNFSRASQKKNKKKNKKKTKKKTRTNSRSDGN